MMLAANPAEAGFAYFFDINISQATCNGGFACSNDDTLDTFQHPGALATAYDLKFHTSAVPGVDVAYGGGSDPDGIAEMVFTAKHGPYIAITSFDLIPIIAGTYNVKVDGIDYVVGPSGLTVSGSDLGTGSPITIQWDNDNAIGITNIQGVVPEPATWAMMLVGFFGLGAVLRKRRASRLCMDA
jgi:hypothetical protein